MATLSDIDYFAVLMLENRSFDNLLGRLGYVGTLYNLRPPMQGLASDDPGYV